MRRRLALISSLNRQRNVQRVSSRIDGLFNKSLALLLISFCKDIAVKDRTCLSAAVQGRIALRRRSDEIGTAERQYRFDYVDRFDVGNVDAVDHFHRAVLVNFKIFRFLSCRGIENAVERIIRAESNTILQARTKSYLIDIYGVSRRFVGLIIAIVELTRLGHGQFGLISAAVRTHALNGRAVLFQYLNGNIKRFFADEGSVGIEHLVIYLRDIIVNTRCGSVIKHGRVKSLRGKREGRDLYALDGAFIDDIILVVFDIKSKFIFAYILDGIVKSLPVLFDRDRKFNFVSRDYR